jgi:ABC-type phosphate/phosphonate transport system permease subunit
MFSKLMQQIALAFIGVSAGGVIAAYLRFLRSSACSQG